MKAIQITSFVPSLSDLRVSDDVPTPTLRSPTQLLVTVTHSALNHVDLLYARGLHQNNHSGLVRPPFVLGLEFAGVVKAIGTRVSSSSSRFRVGDRVWGSAVGGYAETVCVEKDQVFPVPAGWTLEQVAGLGAATAPVSYGALAHVGGVKKGDVVVVHAAAGGLGVVGVQIAAALGARVIGTVGSEEKARVVRQIDGVVGVVRYDVDGWEKEVVKLSGGRQGADVVYDTVGLVEKSIRCLRFGGTVVIAGFAGLGGKMESLTMNRVLLKNARLLGYRYGESGRRDPNTIKQAWEGLTRLLESGSIKPIIYKTYKGLDSVPNALEDLAARKVWGKAVVEIKPQAAAASQKSAKL